MNLTRTPLALLLATAALLGAACGDDSDDAADEASQPAATDTTDDTTEEVTDASPIEADLPAWCESFQSISGVDPAVPDPEQLEKNVNTLREAFDGFVVAAPDDIREHSETIADLLGEFLDQVEAADYVVAEVDSAAYFDDPAIAEAGGAITEYAEANCALEPAAG